MADTAVAAKTCTKCNENPATNGHQWCKSCKAEYQREYTETQKEMLAAKAWADGAQAMKHLLVTAFLKLSLVPIRGGEAARYIAEATPPRYGEQPMPAPGPQSLPNRTAPEVANGSR